MLFADKHKKKQKECRCKSHHYVSHKRGGKGKGLIIERLYQKRQAFSGRYQAQLFIPLATASQSVAVEAKPTCL